MSWSGINRESKNFEKFTFHGVGASGGKMCREQKALTANWFLGKCLLGFMRGKGGVPKWNGSHVLNEWALQGRRGKSFRK